MPLWAEAGVWGAVKGFSHAHVGWLFHLKGMERGVAYGKDLYDDVVVRRIDRLYVLANTDNPQLAYAIVPDVEALPLVLTTLQQLRRRGVRVHMHAPSGVATPGQGMGSMKSQFKKADGSGARHALIFGGDELARGEVTLKALRDGEGAHRDGLQGNAGGGRRPRDHAPRGARVGR